MKTDRLIRGRLKKEFAPEVKEYISMPLWEKSSGLLFKTYNYINIAHVIMLYERKIVSLANTKTILTFLLELEHQSGCPVKYGAGGEFYLDLESFIIEKIGYEAGGRIHTGRSRNDLLATAHRMILRSELVNIAFKLIKLIEVENSIARVHTATIMPGYTHLQHAQPISLGHFFNGHSSCLLRDFERIFHCFKAIDQNPLGAGALSGVTFPVDRERTTKLLGFESVLLNTLDAVASRDFCADIAYAISILGCNISRLSEDLYLWNTSEFGFIEIDDQYSEISSIMPQKKNPFIIETCRSKTGKLYGALIGILTVLKGITFSQCRDITGEVLPNLLNGLNEIQAVLSVLPGLLETLKFNKNRMKESAGDAFSTATDLVDYLVREHGLPFRSAHHIVAKVVHEQISANQNYKTIDAAKVSRAAKEITGNPIRVSTRALQKVIDPEACVRRRTIEGGPAPESVNKMVASTANRLLEFNKAVLSYRKKWDDAKMNTLSIAKEIAGKTNNHR
jgi:argininosuccinate lyase